MNFSFKNPSFFLLHLRLSHDILFYSKAELTKLLPEGRHFGEIVIDISYLFSAFPVLLLLQLTERTTNSSYKGRELGLPQKGFRYSVGFLKLSDSTLQIFSFHPYL